MAKKERSYNYKRERLLDDLYSKKRDLKTMKEGISAHLPRITDEYVTNFYSSLKLTKEDIKQQKSSFREENKIKIEEALGPTQDKIKKIKKELAVLETERLKKINSYLDVRKQRSSHTHTQKQSVNQPINIGLSKPSGGIVTVENRPVVTDTSILNSAASNDTAKVKSFARQMNELQKNILSGSFSEDDINKAYESLNAAKKDRKIKVDKYLETRAKRPHNIKKPVLDNKPIEKPAAAATKAGKQKHIYTVFDFETNGKIKGNGVDKVMPEVLSYSAQKYELDLLTGKSELKESMQGYYQPKDGNFNAGAQRVHGLDQAKIEAARTNENYGATFEDDKAKLIEFMNKDSDAIVAHNLNEFDGNYFVGQLDEEITKVDTYTVAKDAHLETNVLQYSEANNGDIHTKTNSSVYHYYENKMPEGDLHDAINDVKITAENYHNMVLDEKTGLAHNLGLDKTNVKEFNRAKSDHYYRITVGKNGEKITTKMSTKTNKPLTVEGEVADALKRKEKAMAGVTKKDIVENAKATTRKFGDTMREFGTAAKKFSDDFSKLSTGKKAGRIAGATAIIGGGALLVKTAKDRRKAEQEKLKSITASVEKNRSGGF